MTPLRWHCNCRAAQTCRCLAISPHPLVCAHCRRARVETISRRSPLINDPRSAGAESFRALRTAIQVASQSGRLRTLLVTSPLFGEGKSTVAYNTAVAFALSGKRVLAARCGYAQAASCTTSSIAPALRDSATFCIGKAKVAVLHLCASHPADPVAAPRRLRDDRFRRVA